MRNEDRSAVSTPCRFGTERVACFTCRSFDRHLLFLRERANVCRTEFKLNAVSRCRASAWLAGPCPWQAERLPYNLVVVTLDEPFHKSRVGIARSSAQSMIQVADDQSFVAEAD